MVLRRAVTLFAPLSFSLVSSSSAPPIHPVDGPTLPWWLVKAPFQDRNASTTSELPSEADIVIIGSGMTGASAAFHLSTAGVGHGVVLLDARGVSAGATGRNGGHIIEDTQDFKTLAAAKGDDVVRELMAFEDHTVEAVIDFVLLHNVSADLIRGPPALGSPSLQGGQGAFVFPSETDMETRQAVIDYLREHQPDARVTKSLRSLGAREAQTLYGSPSYVGAVQMAAGGSMWPAKVVFELVRLSLEGGVNLQTHTMVNDVQEANSGTHPLDVHTSRGTIRARQVLFATNAWTGGLVPELRPHIQPTPGQIIATAPVKSGAWNFTNLIMEDNDDSEYMIQRQDGRVMLGTDLDHGDWDKSGTWDDSERTVSRKASKFLRSYLPRMFPELFPDGVVIEREWVGIEAYSSDEIPWVGPLPGRLGQFVSAAYTGHGMPTAFLCGKAVASMMLGDRPEHFVDAFLPAARLGGTSELLSVHI